MMTTMMIMMTRTTFMMVTMGVMKMIIIIQGNWHWRYWWCDQAVCNTNCTNCWFVKNCVFLNCSWHYYFIVLNKQRYHFHFVFWGSVAKKPRVRIDGSLPAAWQDEKKSMLLRCGSWSSAIVFLFLVWPCLSLGDQAAAASEIRHGKAAVTSWQVQQKKTVFDIVMAACTAWKNLPAGIIRMQYWDFWLCCTLLIDFWLSMW